MENDESIKRRIIQFYICGYANPICTAAEPACGEFAQLSIALCVYLAAQCYCCPIKDATVIDTSPLRP